MRKITMCLSAGARSLAAARVRGRAGARRRLSVAQDHAGRALSAGRRRRRAWRASSREKLSGVLGHQVIVDNRGRRLGGLVGTRTVIRSAPDGYTLFLGHTGSISINPSLYANAGFDPRKDFTAIGLFASMPVALLAHPSFPAKTIGEVVALAKKEAGKLNIGTSAVGTGGYLSAELFKSITGVQATIIPYKGTAQLMNDLLGGHVPVAFGVLPPAMGNLAGRHAARHRHARASSASACCPTCRPSTNPACRASSRCCITACSAPAGMPQPIVDKLNAAMRKASPIRRGQEAHQHRGRRSADLDAGGIRRRHRPGGAQVGRADHEAQSEGGVRGFRAPPCRPYCSPTLSAVLNSGRGRHDTFHRSAALAVAAALAALRLRRARLHVPRARRASPAARRWSIRTPASASRTATAAGSGRPAPHPERQYDAAVRPPARPTKLQPEQPVRSVLPRRPLAAAT